MAGFYLINGILFLCGNRTDGFGCINNLQKQVYFFATRLLLVNVRRRDTY